jgi:hypothetical protein
MSAPGDGYGPQRRPLEPTRREDGRAPRRYSNRLQIAPHDRTAGMDQFGKVLRFIVRDRVGDHRLPDRPGEVIEPRQRMGTRHRVRYLLCEH